jgi:hypothetical protein
MGHSAVAVSPQVGPSPDHSQGWVAGQGWRLMRLADLDFMVRG